MRRRGAGEGSIFKDDRSGRWRALLDVGEDASGRRRRRKVSGRTRAEVAAKLRELQRDLEDGVSSAGRQITIAVLCEDWLRHHSGELSGNTIEVRTWAVRLHIIPSLGARRVRELTADDVARFLLDKASAATRARLSTDFAVSSCKFFGTQNARDWSCETLPLSFRRRPVRGRKVGP